MLLTFSSIEFDIQLLHVVAETDGFSMAFPPNSSTGKLLSRQGMRSPPLTFRTVPVTYEARSEER